VGSRAATNTARRRYRQAEDFHPAASLEIRVDSVLKLDYAAKRESNTDSRAEVPR
jgi:hypothetical protein